MGHHWPGPGDHLDDPISHGQNAERRGVLARGPGWRRRRWRTSCGGQWHECRRHPPCSHQRSPLQHGHRCLEAIYPGFRRHALKAWGK